MTYPTPDDLRDAPLWENYVIAQAVQACAGVVPKTALAIGVSTGSNVVRLWFQLSDIDAGVMGDIQDIASELGGLLGDVVRVESSYEVVQYPDLFSRRIAAPIFLARPEVYEGSEADSRSEP